MVTELQGQEDKMDPTLLSEVMRFRFLLTKEESEGMEEKSFEYMADAIDDQGEDIKATVKKAKTTKSKKVTTQDDMFKAAGNLFADDDDDDDI